MYSEDLYASHITDHSVLIMYTAVFAIMVVGVILRMTFHTGSQDYKYNTEG